MSVTEEFNRQIKDETSRKSFAARFSRYLQLEDVTNAFSIELDLVLIPSIENLSRTYPEEDVDNMGPVDIGIARSIMNKVLSSIIKQNNCV
jgi:hypothetical protein